MKKYILILAILVNYLILTAQIDASFYGSRYNVSLMHSRINATNANNSGKTSFTSANLFDFSFGESGNMKSYFEANMRVVNDVWWMLGKEIGGKSDYLSNGYTTSIFEFKWGLNVFSTNKLLITPGLTTNSYWSVFNQQRTLTWCVGPMVKVDYLLLDKFLIRNMIGFDIPFLGRSTLEFYDKSKYFTNRTELIHKKGFFFGFDYLLSAFKSKSNSNLKGYVNRFDVRLGYRIKINQY